MFDPGQSKNHPFWLTQATKIGLAVLLLASLISIQSIKPTTAHAATPFTLYTRVTPQTWSSLQPFLQPKDLFWGDARAVPNESSAYTFPYLSRLTRLSDAQLANYTAVNLDGEYRDPAVALAEAPKIRSFVDAYNGRHPSTPLRWVAFYHLNIIDADPSIVSYPDVTMIGKSGWSGSEIVQEAQPYVSLIRQHGGTPGVVLGNYFYDRSRTIHYYSDSQVLANFHAVIDPAPTGLGVPLVGFFYTQDSDNTLVTALQSLR